MSDPDLMVRGWVFKRCGCRLGEGRWNSRCLWLRQRGHGSWYAVLELPVGADGQRRRLRRGGFPTRQAARAALAGWQSSAGPVWSTGEWLTAWLESRSGLRASTRRAYESHVRLYLLPALGEIPLADLTGGDVQAMFARYARRPVTPGRPLTPASRLRVRATLRTALSVAERAGLVERNAARDAELPSGRRPHPVVWTDGRVRAWRAGGPRPPVGVWTPAQTAAFLAFVADDPLALLFRLIALRGLRRGEACALYWADVDLPEGTVTVSRQLVEVKGTPVLSEPKSAASHRSIALDAETVRLLARRRVHSDPAGPVFPGRGGGPVRPGTVSHRFRELSEAAGLPPVRLHDLRHGAASLALAAGADLKVVQDLLGHASIVLTADTYTSVLPDLARACAEATARLVCDAGRCPPGRPDQPRHRYPASVQAPQRTRRWPQGR